MNILPNQFSQSSPEDGEDHLGSYCRLSGDPSPLSPLHFLKALGHAIIGNQVVTSPDGIHFRPWREAIRMFGGACIDLSATFEGFYVDSFGRPLEVVRIRQLLMMGAVLGPELLEDYRIQKERGRWLARMLDTLMPEIKTAYPYFVPSPRGGTRRARAHNAVPALGMAICKWPDRLLRFMNSLPRIRQLWITDVYRMKDALATFPRAPAPVQFLTVGKMRRAGRSAEMPEPDEDDKGSVEPCGFPFVARRSSEVSVKYTWDSSSQSSFYVRGT